METKLTETKRKGIIQNEIKPILTKQFLGEIQDKNLTEKNRESIVEKFIVFQVIFKKNRSSSSNDELIDSSIVDC